MRCYRPLQRRDNMKWDFTYDGEPTGYCVGHDGHHDTELEARECYTEYLLDKRLRFGHLPDSKHRCQFPECGEWTQGIARLGDTGMYILCEEHQTREAVKELHGPACDMWIS